MIRSSERVIWLDGREIRIPAELDAPREKPQVPMAPSLVVDGSPSSDNQASFLHSQRLESLGVLVGGIAHDFNNLLVAILGYAELALEQIPKHHAFRTNVVEIRKAAKQASQLTNLLLAYSGKGEIAIKSIDANRVVMDMAHMLRTVIAKASMLKLDLQPGLEPVMADVVSIQQVILNLVTNASDAMEPNGGEIRVTTRMQSIGPREIAAAHVSESAVPGRYVCIEVADNGCGIDPASLKRIFAPFFTTKTTGRGLGLSAVLGIVSRHKGLLFLDSDPGRGAVFQILLPPCDEPSIDDDESAPERPAAIAATVLAADSDSNVRRLLKRMFAHLGVDMIDAENVREAVFRLATKTSRIDAVILGVKPGAKSDVESVRMLTALHPDLPVIIASGNGEDEVQKHFGRFGVAGYLSKPFSLSDVRRTIADALPRSRGM